MVLAAVIVAVLAAATAVGWKLPAEHRVAREAEFPQGAGTVWGAISDFSSLAAWMPGVRRVHRLEAVDGRERWLYETAEGDMTIEVVHRAPPTALTIRSVSSELPFGGTWTHKISPTATGSLLTIAEHGWIANPFFRFTSRYVFGVTATADETLVALGRHLGSTVRPRPASFLTGS
jgi:hypothetical protein